MNFVKWITVLIGVAFAVLVSGHTGTAQSSQSRYREVVLVGQRTNRSLNVMGEPLTVRGNGNQITWSGYTSVLRVVGNGNRVFGDAARYIIVSGRNNQIYWKRPYNGRSPRTNKSGRGNWIQFNGKTSR